MHVMNEYRRVCCEQRRDDLYACKVRTGIQSVIDYVSSNFCFLADEALRKAAGDYFFSLADFHLVPAASICCYNCRLNFFSVKDAPFRETPVKLQIKEGFEGISTARYSYLAESTGSRRD